MQQKQLSLNGKTIRRAFSESEDNFDWKLMYRIKKETSITPTVIPERLVASVTW